MENGGIDYGIDYGSEQWWKRQDNCNQTTIKNKNLKQLLESTKEDVRKE